MSKFTKVPVKIPETVKVDVDKNIVKITGPKGSLEKKFPSSVEIEIKDRLIFIKNKEKIETKFGRAIIGTIKSHITNMINGVQNAWNKKLEINGTGYRAEIKGDDLILTIGFSHTVTVTAPAGIKFSIEKNIITVEGINKDTVGLIAAKIKEVRRPDPYKGKGIKYLGEVLKLKPGKQAAKAGGAA